MKRAAKKAKTRSYKMGARALGVEATEQRILDETYALFLERPYDAITLKLIAERADCSLQTVMNRFGSKDRVLTESLQRVIESQRAAATPGDAPGALRVLLEDYETHGDAIMRVLALEERIPATHELLEVGRRSHRAWVARTFVEWLPADPGPERERRLGLLVVATDVYTWKLLRRDQGLGRKDTERSMLELLTGLGRRKGGTT